MVVLNIIFNIMNIIIFAYSFNKIKNIHYKSTYFIFGISTILGGLITKFTYDYQIYCYILVSFIFTIIYKIFHKIKYEILDFILMFNLMLVYSLITAFPILFIGYNGIYMLLNMALLLNILLIMGTIDFNVIFSKIKSFWNRDRANPKKMKSITLRNLCLIFICIMTTGINVFINACFLKIYYTMF